MARKHARKPRVKPRPLNGAIWNMKFGRPVEDVRRFLKRTTREHDLDFVLLQEARDYFVALKKDPIPGYVLIGNRDARGHSQNPILVKESVLVEQARVKKMTRTRWYVKNGPMHAGSYSTAARLDGWLRVLSVHMPVSVDFRHARAFGPSRRVAAYIEHALRNVAFARNAGKGRKTLIGGDWNEGPRSTGKHTPKWQARAAGLRIVGPLRGPGHDRIDYVLTNARISGLKREGTGGSDHGMTVFTVHPRP